MLSGEGNVRIPMSMKRFESNTKSSFSAKTGPSSSSGCKHPLSAQRGQSIGHSLCDFGRLRLKLEAAAVQICGALNPSLTRLQTSLSNSRVVVTCLEVRLRRNFPDSSPILEPPSSARLSWPHLHSAKSFLRLAGWPHDLQLRPILVSVARK